MYDAYDVIMRHIILLNMNKEFYLFLVFSPDR
jgi:hypothetical protein